VGWGYIFFWPGLGAATGGAGKVFSDLMRSLMREYVMGSGTVDCKLHCFYLTLVIPVAASITYTT